MPTETDLLLDRRQMRRRVTFWRVAAIALLAIAALAMLAAAGAFSGINVKGDHIARVEISGTIMSDRELITMLDEIAEDETVKAMLVSISSPGGTAVGGEEIYDAVRRVAQNKPVAASVQTLAASAGYMIAVATDRIFARNASIVGSIGVILQYPNVSGLLDKIGVTVEEVKSTPLKGEPSPFHDASPAAKQALRRFIDDSYEWFVDLVAERRPFDRATALRLADGSVYSGRQGLENQLVDALGGELETKAWLAEQAGVDGDIDITTWKPKRENQGLFGATAFGRMVAALTGLPLEAVQPDDLPALFPKRLFLDGALAIWHDRAGQ